MTKTDSKVITAPYCPLTDTHLRSIVNIIIDGGFSMSGNLAAPWENVMELVHIMPPSVRDQHNAQAAGLEVIEYLKRRLTAITAADPRPLGLMLSGGIDSTLIAAAAALGLTPICVTVVAAELENTDEQTAAETAASLGLRHEVVRLDQKDILTLAKSCISVLETDELWEIGSAIPIKAAFDFFKRIAITGPILVGAGADTLFAGGKRLVHDVSSLAALSELDDLFRLQVSRCFTEHWPIPDYFERLLNADANRFIKVFQTIEAWELSRSLAPSALWIERNGSLHDKAL